MPEISIATSCLATRVDIRIPIDSDTSMNSSDTSTTHIRLPDIGTLIRNTDRQSTISRMKAETTKYGIALASITEKGFTGETSSTSIVPLSFSRTMDTEVIIAHTSMRIMPMTPGTKLKALFI